MNFSLAHSIEILERTPNVLGGMLSHLSPEWTMAHEGENTWSVYDIVGHLIEGERNDWIPRMDIILSDRTDKVFEPFNRFAQFEHSNGKSLPELLEEFRVLRMKNVQYLRSKELTGDKFNQEGIHPHFGVVTLSELLATWTVHDLNHIAQISRVMAKQYRAAVGPWINYLRVLQE